MVNFASHPYSTCPDLVIIEHFFTVIFSTAKNGCIMEQNEGNVFVEYSLITVLISVGVALMLNGASQQITNIWNMIAAFVIK